MTYGQHQPLLPAEGWSTQLLGRCWGKAGAWPPVITPLPSAHSYNLSCELEPPSESASNTLRTKKNTAIVKRWSE